MKKRLPIKFFFFSQILLIYLITQTRNPYLLSLILILQALTHGLCCWFLQMKWVGLGLVIIFIGGMMILFLYVASLTAGSKIQWKITPQIIRALIISWAILPITNLWSLEVKANTPGLIFSGLQTSTLVFLIAYLLLLLLIVVKTLESFKGALVEKF